MVVAGLASYGSDNCSLIIDNSSNEVPCPPSGFSATFADMTKSEAELSGLPYAVIGNDRDAAVRKVGVRMVETRNAILAQITPSPTPFGQKWVVLNGRFEVGEKPLKPNYITETIVLTEARAKEYGFTVYVPITTTYEDAHSELMRVLGNPPTPS